MGEGFSVAVAKLEDAALDANWRRIACGNSKSVSRAHCRCGSLTSEKGCRSGRTLRLQVRVLPATPKPSNYTYKHDMTKAEQNKMMRIEIENKNLRDSIDKHIEIYREQLYEIVDLRTKIEIIEFAIVGGDHA